MLLIFMIVNEIYRTILGESSYAGYPVVIIRLTGCNLRCKWCDTQYAYYEGKEMSIDEIIHIAQNLNTKLILITGGEPLSQKDTTKLIQRFIDQGYQALIETNGSLPIDPLPAKTHIILDVKCPSSGMSDKMDFDNLKKLKKTDEVKFVIGDKFDFDWAISMLNKNPQIDQKNVIFSPVYNQLKPDQLASWILNSRLNARLGLQLHKIIWKDKDRGI